MDNHGTVRVCDWVIDYICGPSLSYINWDIFKLRFVGLIKDVEYVKLEKYETCDTMNMG